MGILLYIIAYILNFLLTPVVVVYTFVRAGGYYKINNYFEQTAEAIDVKGNIVCQFLFNDILIKESGYKFGKLGDKISYVLSLNKQMNTLTWLGKIIARILINVNDPAFKTN